MRTRRRPDPRLWSHRPRGMSCRSPRQAQRAVHAGVLSSTRSVGSRRVSRGSAVEKEFAQAAGRAETAGKPDRAGVPRCAVHNLRAGTWLRQLCWVLTTSRVWRRTSCCTRAIPADLRSVGGGDPACAQYQRTSTVVLGVQWPGLPPPALCSGLMVPTRSRSSTGVDP